MSAKTLVCRHHAGMLTQVTDRCKHLYSTYVFGYEKGHFLFLINVRTYVLVCTVYCLCVCSMYIICTIDYYIGLHAF